MTSFVDGHCDTIVKIADAGESLFVNQRHIDLKRLSKFTSPLQFFAIWLEPKYYPVRLRKTLEYIDYYEKQLYQNQTLVSPILSYDDILKSQEEQKIGALLTIEGGEALEGNISVLRTFYRLGVRAMTLTWNYRNELADGVLEGQTGGGLTNFGKSVVAEMNRLGMMVDVSHLSESGFWDVVKVAEAPFIATHSNAKGVCPASRNLSDDQIRAIAQSGGVIGLNLYAPFLTQEKQASLEDVLLHLDYMLHLVGDDAIGLGCDFDGIDQTPIDICGVSDLKLLFDVIEKRYGKKTMEKLASKNFLRVLKKILK